MTPPVTAGSTTLRLDGYAPIGAYAAIGDGRTAALIASDGSVDWLCLPSFSDPSVFGALLDARDGGRFALAPLATHESSRRYLPHTNVLETTFTTADGSVRVTDSLNLQDGGLLPWTELARRVECVAGRVEMGWRVEPRFDHGRAPPSIARRGGVPVASNGELQLALPTWEAGEPQLEAGAVAGAFELAEGQRATLAALAFYDEPLLVPRREDLEARLDGTAATWRRFGEAAEYEGPWREEVVRSALALKLLIQSPTGAICAAATTSLPEAIGGERNFDYRYAWVRDSTFTMDALLRLGYPAQAHGALSALLRAARHTHPRVQPVYALDGRPLAAQEELDLPGYRGSRPVLVGNAAGGQVQLSNYGDLLETVALYVRDGGAIDAGTGLRLAQVVDVLCELWSNADAGIWELGQREHYTESKMGCWTAFDRAVRLAESGQLPDDRVARWREAARAARAFVQERCWSERQGAYARSSTRLDELDASVLLVARNGFVAPDDAGMLSTIDAVRRELARGPFVYRYSGMWEQEGAFVACSFWLVEALARGGRGGEAAELMQGMLEHANDVGLFAEEIDPDSGELLGNFPQGLSHLALINAAVALEQAPGRSMGC